MSMTETLEASQVLRRYTHCFESCVKKGKDLEARTYLPNIRKACEVLELDFLELMGDGFRRIFVENVKSFEKRSEPFTEIEKPLPKRLQYDYPLLSVCPNCLSEFKMKKGKVYCKSICRSQYHNKQQLSA